VLEFEMDLRAVLTEVHEALDEAGIDHAVIGGLALAAHGSRRLTVDVDFIADGAKAEEIDALVVARGYECLHRSEQAGNYAHDLPERGRVDFLFVHHAPGRRILDRADELEVSGQRVRVVQATDLIGLKVQSSSNDARRLERDMADVRWLLANATVDVEEVREYFRLFQREEELEGLIQEVRP
jgi:predicted nucleotidyltransferase